MKAEIISVGTELLMGQIVNTDAQYLSKELSELGIDVFYHHVVGDNAQRLKELLKKVIIRSDIIITTGGIGPTQDDLTKETVADVFNLPMIEDKASVNKLNNFFQSIHKDITINNLKQAYFPKGARVLKNERGTAPGCMLEIEGKIIIILPGPPRELNHMFQNEVKTYLEGKAGYIIKSNMIKIFGVGESELEHRLMDFIEKQDNPTLATYASAGEVSLRITAKAKDETQADKLLKPVIKEIQTLIGESIYSVNGETMPQVVYKLLLENNKKTAFAESCTGGMLSSQIVDIPGSSNVLDMSVISYSNESKVKNLNVSIDTLEKYGAVSREVVFEMAKGLLDISRADFTVSVSGIAGPSGATEDKPVGLVYICLYDGENKYIRELKFARERNYNRKYACLHALDMIKQYLTKRL